MLCAEEESSLLPFHLGSPLLLSVQAARESIRIMASAKAASFFIKITSFTVIKSLLYVADYGLFTVLTVLPSMKDCKLLTAISIKRERLSSGAHAIWGVI